MSVLVVGSVALDSIKTPQGRVKEVLGGSAVYFSLSATFFTPVNLVAVVGKDFSYRHIELLKKRRIDLKGLEIKPGKTFRWKGAYGWDFSDARTISTDLNVFSEFDPVIPEEYKKSKYLFLANIDPYLQERVLKQVRPKLVVCDTMNYWIENKRNFLLRLLKKVDVFLLNESEARQLTQESNIVKAVKIIIKFGPKMVIVKKGEHGCLFFSDKYIFSIPAFLLESIVDPTGAGDTFAGGMVGYLAQCNKLTQTEFRQSVVYGSVMATFAVEDFSVRRLTTISQRDIQKRLNDFKRLSCF